MSTTDTTIEKLRAVIRSNASDGEKENAKAILRKIPHCHDWFDTVEDAGRICKICYFRQSFLDIFDEQYPPKEDRYKEVLLIK